MELFSLRGTELDGVLHQFLCACLDAGYVASTVYMSVDSVPTETCFGGRSRDRVNGQLRGGKLECTVSGKTSSGIVWRMVPEAMLVC